MPTMPKVESNICLEPTMTKRCIARVPDGQICGKLAIVIDYQRGGMVCQEHASELLLSRIRDLQGRIRELEKAVQNLKTFSSGWEDKFNSEHASLEELKQEFEGLLTNLIKVKRQSNGSGVQELEH
jgi:hypothetical protein